MSERTSTGAWREALDCVDALLPQAPRERARFLLDLSNSKPDLHDRVQLLLRADAAASKAGFLEFDRTKAESAPAALATGMTLGPYRIVDELGKGGMGEVWLATRADGLYEGQVAIKTLHPYFAAGALRDRFLREANILGRLTHPNIARLLDAGVSDGIVFLVLEYVRGEPLDRWCDRRKIDVEGRLRLFVDVCGAVAHAHANLIVHRDIKPSNILVTDEGVVKLLDFGIGKLVESEPAAEQTDLTRITGRVFTPEFAAPEQILGQPITTATDIYSLGVLLHVLLSGTRPYVSIENEIELQRAVVHDDPIAMSRAVAALNDDEIAARRSTSLPRLRRRLSGDLSHLVARALRKPPRERYGSVLEFASDVERHLRHEPVTARSGSRAYRFNRFVRRHRAAAMAVAFSATALIAGAGVAVWQARVAHEQARVATVEAAKATSVKNFLLDIFNTNSERHPDGARARQTTAEELVGVASEKILSGTDQDPDVRVELMGTLGNLTVALDKREQGEALQRKRVEFITEKFGANDLRLAEALLDLSGVLRQRDKIDEALAGISQAIDILDRNGQSRSMLRARAELEAGHTLYIGRGGDGSNLIARYQNAVALFEKHPPSESLERALIGLARAYELSRRFDQATETLQRVLSLAIPARRERSGAVANAHQMLARIYAERQQFAEAVDSNRKAVEIYTFLVGARHTSTINTRMDLGNMLNLQGMHKEAAGELEQVLAERIAVDGDENIDVQTVRLLLSTATIAIGDWQRAQALLDAAIPAVGKLQNKNSLPGLLRLRARLALEQGRYAQALKDADAAWDLIQKTGRGPRSVVGGAILATRGDALVAMKEAAQGRESLEKAVALLKETERDPARPLGLAAEIGLGVADLERGRLDDAKVLLGNVLDNVRALDRRKEFWVVEETALRALARIQLDLKDFGGACSSLQSAVALRSANALAFDPRLRKSQALQTQHCKR